MNMHIKSVFVFVVTSVYIFSVSWSFFAMGCSVPYM